MRLTQLLERLRYEVSQGSDGINVTELINDSRKVTEGSVFVCISGAVSDGHAFARDVAEKGAAALVGHWDHRDEGEDHYHLYGEVYPGGSRT